MPVTISTRSLTIPCTCTVRGPFTAGATLLGIVVPELLAVAPDAVHTQALAVNAIAPELGSLVPPPAGTLTTNAPQGERTRYFSSARPRLLAHAVAAIVDSWVREATTGPVSITFTNVADADASDLALIDVLREYCRDERLAFEVDGAATPRPVASNARAFVDADGAYAQPDDYLRMTASERAALHTARAHTLAEQSTPGADLGAIPYHLELGDDPAGAGAEALHHVLEYCFDAGFYDAAVDAAERGLRLITRETQPELHSRFTLRLVSALSSLGRVEEALAHVHAHKRVTTCADDQMQLSYALAMLYTRQPGTADPWAALEWANTAIALADTNPDAGQRAFHGAFMRNARALVELHLGHTTIARDLVNEAIALTDANLTTKDHLLHRTVLVHNRGRVALALGDVVGALRDFTVVVNRDPFYEDALFDRARAHSAAGDLAAAVADYTRAIELRDTFIEAYYNRAELLLEEGEEDQALTDLNAVLGLDADHVPALTNRAGLLLQSGALDTAESDIRRGLGLEPCNADLLTADGLLHQEHGDVDGARKCFDRAVEAQPEHVPALAGRAVLNYTVGNFQESLVDLDRAVALSPTPELVLNRGVAHQALGRLELALDDFDLALREGGDVAELLYRRGSARLALGDPGGWEDWDEHLRLEGGTSTHADEIAAARVFVIDRSH